jgi:hypothetical protein
MWTPDQLDENNVRTELEAAYEGVSNEDMNGQLPSWDRIQTLVTINLPSLTSDQMHKVAHLAASLSSEARISSHGSSYTITKPYDRAEMMDLLIYNEVQRRRRANREEEEANQAKAQAEVDHMNALGATDPDTQ